MRWYAIFSLMLLAACAAGHSVPIGRPGLAQVAPKIWIDSDATPPQRAMALRHIDAAQRNVARALGPALVGPEWRICFSAHCQPPGPQPRGVSWHDQLIRIHTRGANNPKVYTHELVHVQLNHAQGISGWVDGRMPIWFNEGMATLIAGSSGDPQPGECPAERGKPLPRTAAQFSAMVGPAGLNARAIYRRSACAVQDWLAQGHQMRDVITILGQGGHLP